MNIKIPSGLNQTSRTPSFPSLKAPQVTEIPQVAIPEPLNIPTPYLNIPTPDVPSYRPLQLYGTPVPPRNPPPPRVSVPKIPESKERPSQKQPALEPPQKPRIPAPVSLEEPQDGFESKEVTTIEIPIVNLKVPVPRKEVVVTAATTSVVSVGAALIGTSIFKRLLAAMKPVIKAAVKKLQKLRGKPTQSWARERLQGRYQRIKNGTASLGGK